MKFSLEDTPSLFEDELLQGIFSEAVPASQQLLDCHTKIGPYGHELHCRDQSKRYSEILKRLPLSIDTLEAIETTHNYLLNKISDIRAEIKERQDLVLEMEGLINDAHNHYDDVVLQEDEQALYDLDAQIEDWTNNIASLKKGIAPYQRVIKKINIKVLIVERMAKTVQLGLVSEEVDKAEAIFDDQLDTFISQYKTFILIASKKHDPIYSSRNMSLHVNRRLREATFSRQCIGTLKVREKK